MYNPSYLIKSRHDIYYFRYPLPRHLYSGQKELRVSVSLKTRCPKEALSLANMLEYHGSLVLSGLSRKRMDQSEIKGILHSYFSELLERKMNRIDRVGPYPENSVHHMESTIQEIDLLLKNPWGDGNIIEDWDPDIYSDNHDPVHEDLVKAMNKSNVHFERDSEDYKTMKSLYKYAIRELYTETLKYNAQANQFKFHSPPQEVSVTSNRAFNKSGHKLVDLINIYMAEQSGKKIQEDTYKDKIQCLSYLVELLGDTCLVTDIDYDKARHVRESLLKTPKSRNTIIETRNRPLQEQIRIAQENDLEILSYTSINKYISYFSSLFRWATSLKYINENPFDTMEVSNIKKANRYEYFTKEKISLMLEELAKKENGLARTESNYWGTLIAIFTGARRNEIASLLPDNIEQYEGIWYFDITDEGDNKRLKTLSAKRYVPIHSYLLKRGFLEYVEKARSFKPAPKHKGQQPRLLYDMTFQNKENWGRNLGRFVNETFLPELNLKGDKHVMHSMRHSFITYMNMAGVTPSTLKALVGHEQNTVTEGTYMHYEKEYIPVFKEAIEKLSYS